MNKIKLAVKGLGNLGKFVIEFAEKMPDMECVGVLRRKSSLGAKIYDLRGVPDFDGIESLEEKTGNRPDVIILCNPSRNTPENVSEYLTKGYNTVDSFDIHTDIVTVMDKLQPLAINNGKTSLIGAGWDPGTDSVIRAYLEAMAPTGTTFTNFGRGRSMGHSAAAKAITGVEDAISITIPMGGGRHSRLVYVALKKGEDLRTVTERIKSDNYFSHDPLQVVQVSDCTELDFVADSSHGVLIERIGGAASVSNQSFKFEMRINNPALTAQILLSCARAAVKMPAGVFTIIDIPPIYLLPGDRAELIKRLV
ncbi:MAG: diaminopimelate dehydrogenase [Deferribacteraceae bacterium]|jgi:diaminopimelate dehydrogenase|nr:diaminopimelate dehydrogenase [Deferribacteraceae bacterium]